MLKPSSIVCNWVDFDLCTYTCAIYNPLTLHFTDDPFLLILARLGFNSRCKMFLYYGPLYTNYWILTQLCPIDYHPILTQLCPTDSHPIVSNRFSPNCVQYIILCPIDSHPIVSNKFYPNCVQLILA